jgi:hypothetical protein
LKLVAAESEADGTAAAGTGDDDGTDALTIVALVVGALGVLLGGVALLRGRAAPSGTRPGS